MLSTVFGGSAELLLTNLVNDQNLTASQIQQMREVLDDLQKKRGKKR
jgi:predicted transcriptional regulator